MNVTVCIEQMITLERGGSVQCGEIVAQALLAPLHATGGLLGAQPPGRDRLGGGPREHRGKYTQGFYRGISRIPLDSASGDCFGRFSAMPRS